MKPSGKGAYPNRSIQNQIKVILSGWTIWTLFYLEGSQIKANRRKANDFIPSNSNLVDVHPLRTGNQVKANKMREQKEIEDNRGSWK